MNVLDVKITYAHHSRVSPSKIDASLQFVEQTKLSDPTALVNHAVLVQQLMPSKGIVSPAATLLVVHAQNGPVSSQTDPVSQIRAAKASNWYELELDRELVLLAQSMKFPHGITKDAMEPQPEFLAVLTRSSSVVDVSHAVSTASQMPPRLTAHPSPAQFTQEDSRTTCVSQTNAVLTRSISSMTNGPTVKCKIKVCVRDAHKDNTLHNQTHSMEELRLPVRWHLLQADPISLLITLAEKTNS